MFLLVLIGLKICLFSRFQGVSQKNLMERLWFHLEAAFILNLCIANFQKTLQSLCLSAVGWAPEIPTFCMHMNALDTNLIFQIQILWILPMLVMFPCAFILFITCTTSCAVINTRPLSRNPTIIYLQNNSPEKKTQFFSSSFF